MILPVYGNWADVAECLKLLLSQTVRDFRILIADDGSPEAPPENVRVLPGYSRGENVGFGANCNRAARIALADGATHLLFLNSDVTFGPRFMERWLALAAEMPDAILGPLIFYSQDPDRIWSSGARRLTVFTPFVRARERFIAITPVDTMTGCALLAPAFAWERLGGFDPAFFMYYEDFDFTVRAKVQGIGTYVVPDPQVHVWHHVSGSFRGTDVWRKHELMVESSLIFIRRHYSGIRKAICLTLGVLHLLLTVMVNLPSLPAPRKLWGAVNRGSLLK